MVALQTVEIPGYREAVKKERILRDVAFLDGNELLCGVEIAPLSLRRLIWLEQSHNGFICPWRFDNDLELLAHAVSFIGFLKPNYSPPLSPRYSFWQAFRNGMRAHRISRELFKKNDPQKVVEEIHAYLDECFMDAPKGNGGVADVSYAAYPAYVIDKFGEAGLGYTPDQIMNMPLKRLWQHYRIAAQRLNDAKLTNPSDDLAVRYLEGRK